MYSGPLSLADGHWLAAPDPAFDVAIAATCLRGRTPLGFIGMNQSTQESPARFHR